jgi:hypothetical protein
LDVGVYDYQSVGEAIPAIPILTVQVFQARNRRSRRWDCPSIIDTGSDCTLLPLAMLMQAKGQPIQGMRRIPVCGMEVMGIPVMVGLVFGQYELSKVCVYGVSDEEIGDWGLIERDILNRFKVEFDGPEMRFEIK